MIKLCAITGSRADYGLLSRLLQLISKDSDFTLQIIAANMHLSPEFGLTYMEIEADGLVIDRKVEMLLSSDTPTATSKSVGLGTIGFADAYEYLKPDVLLILGDRYEILSSVISALFFKIPVIHIHGGEITEGSYDNSIRHAITKMSHLHFTATEEYRQRVIQMGERPETVFNFGSLGLDNMKHIKLLSREQIEKNLNFEFGENCILVTFHPATLEHQTTEEQMNNLLSVLSKLKQLRIIFTMPNADTEGRIIIKLINSFVKENRERSVAVSSLGHLRYLSALQYVIAVVGNSSSNLIEAPSFGIPSLNIGIRQRGRTKADSVIDCSTSESDIKEKLELILMPEFRLKCKDIINPYMGEETAMNIIRTIKSFNLTDLIQKRFYNT